MIGGRKKRATDGRKLRVAQVCGAIDGAQWMVDMSAGLMRSGFDVLAIIASPDGDTATRLTEAQVPFITMPQNLHSPNPLGWRLGRIPLVGPSLRRLVDLVDLLRAAARLARVFLREERIDIVHSQIFSSILIGRLAGAMARVPIRIAMIPGPYHLEAELFRKADLLTYRLDHRIVSGSQYTDNLYAQLGVASRRRRVVAYGADPAGFDPDKADPDRIRREFGISPSTPLVGQVAFFYQVLEGRAAPPLADGRGIKGQEDFVAAAQIVLERRPDARFLLVGGGWGALGEQYRESVERLCETLGIADSVTFTGSRHDVPDILAALDVSVQCSLTENYGGTLESLLMRAPTIATRVGGMPEVVRDGDTGLLVPPRDPAALAAAMLRLIEDPELGRRFGQRGRDLILDRFTTKHTLEGVEEVYRELIAARLPRGLPNR